MSCCCGHHHCSCGSSHHECCCHGHHHHCGCHEHRHECECHSERESSPHHHHRHRFLSREEYVERLDEEREILERRLRYVKEELDELRKEAPPKS